MKRLLTALFLIPLVLAAIFYAPLWLIGLLTFTAAALAVREFLDIAKAYGTDPLRVPTYIAIATLFAGVLLAGADRPVGSSAVSLFVFAAVGVLAPFVTLAIAMRRTNLAEAYPAAAASTFAVLFVGMPMAMLLQLREQRTGAYLILFLFVVVWSGDTFAYYVGKNFGRHRMAPRVSPKKTWEGAVASLVSSAALGTLLWINGPRISLWMVDVLKVDRARVFGAYDDLTLASGIVLALVLNAAAQLGDLVESAIKRGAGVKDSGAILPGHGGMLDRIDALLFAAPVMWLVVIWRVLS